MCSVFVFLRRWPLVWTHFFLPGCPEKLPLQDVEPISAHPMNCQVQPLHPAQQHAAVQVPEGKGVQLVKLQLSQLQQKDRTRRGCSAPDGQQAGDGSPNGDAANEVVARRTVVTNLLARVQCAGEATHHAVVANRLAANRVELACLSAGNGRAKVQGPVADAAGAGVRHGWEAPGPSSRSATAEAPPSAARPSAAPRNCSRGSFSSSSCQWPLLDSRPEGARPAAAGPAASSWAPPLEAWPRTLLARPWRASVPQAVGKWAAGCLPAVLVEFPFAAPSPFL